MDRNRRVFQWEHPLHAGINGADLLLIAGVAVLLYFGVRVAFLSSGAMQGPSISLSPAALPRYALFSLGRMATAYLLSLLFTLFYGYAAANHPQAGKVLLPVLDVLQSIPILSFLPVALISFTAILPGRLAVEFASISLIFTSQVWNMTFAWYQSLTTIPTELQEADAIFRLNGWLRFRTLELPFAARNLIWNSVMSWSGGWFFLMAAEIFTVGKRDFRLPGLGSYLQEAAVHENYRAVLQGLAMLVFLIVVLDQLFWRPLLAWSERFRLDMVGDEPGTTSWFYDLLGDSVLVGWLRDRIWFRGLDRIDGWSIRLFPVRENVQAKEEEKGFRPFVGRLFRFLGWTGIVLLVPMLVYGIIKTVQFLAPIPLSTWGVILMSAGATFLRVAASLLIAVAWTLPVGVAIGTSPKLAAWLQPVVQITASIPATALFPVILIFLWNLPGGLNIAAVLLMLLGTQWYLLFNIISGTSFIPGDLKNTASLLRLRSWERWRTLTLPALFPYIITGAVTASGGAWNASIVAEYMELGDRHVQAPGIGSLIARATAAGDYRLLLASTFGMILVVVLINRFVWRRLYERAESQFRME